MNSTLPGLIIEMEKIIAARDYDKFLLAEMDAYQYFIKTIETPEHYLRGYRLLESPVRKYGSVLPKITESVSSREQHICYFLPSLDNDLAHVEQLYYLLREHSNSSEIQISIAGFSRQKNSINSRYIFDLYKSRKVRILPIQFSHEGILSLLSYLRAARVSLLAIYSIPTLLGALGMAFGLNRTIWIPTKFPIPIYPEVKHRIYVAPLKDFTHDAQGGVIWHRMCSSAFPKDIIPVFEKRNRSRLKIISINREEKIANPIFLDAVARILKDNDGAIFYWTGRKEIPEIKDYFFSRGFSSRVVYVGWVNPAKIIDDFDIFVDTFGLSGTVSAQAFAAGMPTCCFRGAQTWFEVHEKNIRNKFGDEIIEKILSRTVDDYVNRASELITSPEFYWSQSNLQKEIAENFFTNTREMYNEQIKIVKKIMDWG
jgi:hypothetical protein